MTYHDDTLRYIAVQTPLSLHICIHIYIYLYIHARICARIEAYGGAFVHVEADQSAWDA